MWLALQAACTNIKLHKNLMKLDYLGTPQILKANAITQ